MKILSLFLIRIWSRVLTLYYDINTTHNFLKDEMEGTDLPGYKKEVKGLLNVISKNRPIEITAVYRLKDAEDFLMVSVVSILPLVTEIVFVNNCSSDSTMVTIKRACDLCAQWNVRFKVLQYNSDIIVQGNGYQSALKDNPEGSLAKYYNFCFAQASCKYVYKIDAHNVLKPNMIAKIFMTLERYDVVYMRGENLYGRKMTYEPRIYNKELSDGYHDGENFEYLRLKIDKQVRILSRIHKKSYWHIGLYK